MSLFEPAGAGETGPAPEGLPLAERLRPADLDGFVGQDHLLGPGRILRELILQDQPPSLVFWGPPGSGKTTLARIFAGRSKAHFVSFSAVLCGVKEAKAVMEEARRLRQRTGRRTILFVDEIHRFNRAQQDAFLPFVERGDIVLMGATTENPSFELNAALLSRVKVLVLHPLSDEELVEILRRGAAALETEAAPEAMALAARMAGGDARRALTTLEVASRLAGAGARIQEGAVREALAHRALLYDRSGEEHYNLISAFHKSVRNSDPDAALYWLLRMIESGEDPLYAARRMVVIASEDVGLADPAALGVALHAREAFEMLGLPEGKLALAEAAVYLACAPKSNAVYRALKAAEDAVRTGKAEPVPLHLRNPVTGLMRELGYGKGYAYAHDEEEGVADMECLPPSLVGRHFYAPGQAGFERKVAERLAAIEEARARSRKRHGGGKT